MIPAAVAHGIRGTAASATQGGPQGYTRSPVNQQRAPRIDAQVDSGCNQHLFKNPSLFVTVDRSRVMQPFIVASDRTTTPQGYGTARFVVTDETCSQLTVTLPGCYLDETLPFNLLSVSQLIEAGIDIYMSEFLLLRNNNSDIVARHTSSYVHVCCATIIQITTTAAPSSAVCMLRN
jgi:hypothetical protein